MTHQNRYIVIYKDSPKVRSMHYGPFVSPALAESFMNELPEPLEGGMKMLRVLAPYTYFEHTIARDVILRKRTHGDLLDSVAA